MLTSQDQNTKAFCSSYTYFKSFNDFLIVIFISHFTYFVYFHFVCIIFLNHGYEYLISMLFAIFIASGSLPKRRLCSFIFITMNDFHFEI